MTGRSAKLTSAVEAYFADLRRVRASGGATGERSSYAPLANLLNAVGATLERFCLADSETEFYSRLEKPRAFAREVGAGNKTPR